MGDAKTGDTCKSCAHHRAYDGRYLGTVAECHCAAKEREHVHWCRGLFAEVKTALHGCPSYAPR
jgi:hypothetical protein